MSASPAVHPDIEPLAVLLGTWSGAGAGEYPTIEDFTYTEAVTFGHGGKPFLTYAQRTWAADGRPLHVETGYWRVVAPGRIEIVLAHPTGVTEIAEGSFTTGDRGLSIDVASTSVGLTSTAKSVTEVERHVRVHSVPDTSDGHVALSYTLAMAAVGHPSTHHLAATLHRDTGHRDT